MRVKPLPSAARLRELFNYDPESGVLTRRVTASSNAEAGSIAGTNKKGRLVVRADKKEYLASRLIWKMQTGRDPNGVVDHRDGNTLNDRWNNLRDITLRGNMENKAKSKNNTSGHTGVHFDKRRSHKPWKAQIGHGSKLVYLGSYRTDEEAAAAYAAAKGVLHETHPEVVERKTHD